MPAFVIATPHCRVGQTIDAVTCDPTVTGYPDRRSEVPVKATIREQSLLIDDEARPRAIISCVGENGTTTYMIDGSTSALRNRERRTALVKASSILNQLRDFLVPLINATENSDGLAAEGLGLLFNWIAEERERLTAAPSSSDEGETAKDDRNDTRN